MDQVPIPGPEPCFLTRRQETLEHNEQRFDPFIESEDQGAKATHPHPENQPKGIKKRWLISDKLQRENIQVSIL